METKCYFVKLVALYSEKVLYGYNCNLDNLYSQIYEAKRFYTLEQNVDSCGLYGDVIDELNKFKKRINSTSSSFCFDCTQPKELTCADVVVTLTNTLSNDIYTFSAVVTNSTSPINYNWSYDPTLWSLVIKNGNYIMLQSTVEDGIPVYTNVGVSITDANGCLISTYNFIEYTKETPICFVVTDEQCGSSTNSYTASGTYNGRNYYTIYCSDLITIIGYVYWNSTLSRWELRDALGSGTLYSYSAFNTYYPIEAWTNLLPDVLSVNKVQLGECPQPN
jgi:hypothetical protein